MLFVFNTAGVPAIISIGSYLPDLIPTSLSYNSATGIFSSVVKNQGTAAPTGVVVGVSYSVDGAYCTWGAVNGPLAAGASVTIGISGSGPLPDLILTSLTSNTTTGLFTVVVLNQGTGPTPSGVVIGNAFYVDGTQVTWGAVPGPLAPGASVTINSSGGGAYTISPGTHTISVFVDDVDRMAESNKNNNMLSQTITISP